MVIGGVGAGGSLSSAYSITPAGSIADLKTDPAFARVRPAIVPLPSGNLLVIGGQKLLKTANPETTWEAVASAAIVTPDLEVIQHITHPQFARVDSAAILLDRHHIGVFAGTPHEPEPVLQNLIVLELDDDSLLALDNSGSPIIQTLPWPDGPARRGATISRLDNGQIALLGGCSSWEHASCLDSGLLFSISKSGTPEFTASVPTIGGARGEHQAVMLHDGDVLLTGGGVEAATPAAIVLDGQTLPAMPVKLNLEAGNFGCRDQQVWLLPTGNVMQWGGRCPDETGELTLREDVWFLDSKTGDTEYMSLWRQPGWGHTVAPAGGGGVLVLGGTSSIAVDLAQAAADATGAIRLAGHTQHSVSLPALWYGASFTDTTGAFLPAGSTGVDAHSPGPSCQASMGSMPGWDRTYRIRMGADDTYRIRVTPLDDQHDPAIYVMKSPHQRDGEFCYAGQNLLGAGKPETLQFTASPPTGRGAGDYFVVIDLQTPGTSMDFHIEVVRDFSELSKSIPGGGTP